jgi:hypothetical protein
VYNQSSFGSSEGFGGLQMTEAEWLVCTEPQQILEYLRRKVRSRKARLFACACCRRAWRCLQHSTGQHAVEVGERFADGQAKAVESEEAARAVRLLCGPGVGADISTPYHVARGSRFTFVDAGIAAQHAVFAVTGVRTRGDDPGAEGAERAAQARLLRCIFGNPFRPVSLAPEDRTPTIVSLARTAYDERQLPSGELDLHRLAILADALEEAGAGGELAEHLRSPGPHVRGCFVVDLLLGKE